MSDNFIPHIVLFKKSRDAGRLTPDETRKLINQMPSNAVLHAISVYNTQHKTYATGFVNEKDYDTAAYLTSYQDCEIAAQTALIRFLEKGLEYQTIGIRDKQSINIFIANADAPVEEDAEDMIYTIAAAGDITTDIELMIAESSIKYRVGPYQNDKNGVFYIFRLYADKRPSDVIYKLLDNIRNICRKNKAVCQITVGCKYGHFIDPEKQNTPAILYKEKQNDTPQQENDTPSDTDLSREDQIFNKSGEDPAPDDSVQASDTTDDDVQDI